MTIFQSKFFQMTKFTRNTPVGIYLPKVNKGKTGAMCETF